MALDLNEFYGFGKENLFDVDIKEGQLSQDFNSYAKVTEIKNNLITIDLENATIGQFEKFVAGNVIMLHASTAKSLNAKLGKFICAKITAADDGKLTLDKNIEPTFTQDDLLDYNIQAITFANFHCLNLYPGALVSPIPYDSAKLYGGILLIQVSDECNLKGGHFRLNDCGIAPYQKDYIRPLLEEEITGELDRDKTAGKENIFCNNVFPLNSGDGAIFLLARKLEADSSSRIGNIFTHGKPNCRGAADTKYKPSNVTNVGGSSIFLASEKIIVPFEVLAKYRQTNSSSAALKGKGLARCYIASQPRFLAYGDDKLCYTDIISDKMRVSQKNNIHDFGAGNFGDMENPDFSLCSTALVRFTDGNKVFFKQVDQAGLATFKPGAVVILKSGRETVQTRILEADEEFFSVDIKVDKNCIFAIAVPEFENLILSEGYDEAAFIKVKNKCVLGGTFTDNIHVTAKEIEILPGAKFSDSVFFVAEKISNLDDAIFEKESMIFFN